MLQNTIKRAPRDIGVTSRSAKEIIVILDTGISKPLGWLNTLRLEYFDVLKVSGAELAYCNMLYILSLFYLVKRLDIYSSATHSFRIMFIFSLSFKVSSLISRLK